MAISVEVSEFPLDVNKVMSLFGVGTETDNQQFLNVHVYMSETSIILQVLIPISGALVLMKIGRLQFCSVYTSVLSHLENHRFLLLCLFVNILQICRTEICTSLIVKKSATNV